MSTLLETLASYVPTLIVRRLASDPTPITAPRAERVSAAVLLADISGFMALTERLVQRGPAGVEEVSQLLNAYFEQLVELVEALGGEVVKFAGDALLALWPATQDPTTHAQATNNPCPSGARLATGAARARRLATWARFIAPWAIIARPGPVTSKRCAFGARLATAWVKLRRSTTWAKSPATWATMPEP